MGVVEDSEEVLKEKLRIAYNAWLERNCFQGHYPDTSYFDYCVAPAEAAERGVSVYQVLLEHYDKPAVELKVCTAQFTHQATGAYVVRYR
jgi:hypothetical protein